MSDIANKLLHHFDGLLFESIRSILNTFFF